MGTRRTTAAAEVQETTSPTDSWVPAALTALDAALGTALHTRTALNPGSDPAAPPLEFQPAGASGLPTWTTRRDVPSDLAAVIVRTSGSTGTPKQTLLTAAAIHASVTATAQVLGGHGQWLLTLQPSYVAGFAVLARSLRADTTPVPLLKGTTDPRTFTQAAQKLTAERRFISLVPTQLQRLLDHVPEDESLTAALARFDTILLGGGASSPELLQRAASHGLTVVCTYGMSETCGGCVYDGRPLPGVRLETESVDGKTPGRVRITGPMVASGYLEDPDLTRAHFTDDPESGHRSFLTDDLGEVRTGSAGQTLSISGRVDDVINTGGVKVSAESVRAVLLSHPRVHDAFVGGVPDAEWGQKVSAAVVLASTVGTGSGSAAAGPGAEVLPRELTDLVREALGRAAAPKAMLILPELPLLANDKPDRKQLLRLLSAL